MARIDNYAEAKAFAISNPGTEVLCGRTVLYMSMYTNTYTERTI